jgi:hypothetical protein
MSGGTFGPPLAPADGAAGKDAHGTPVGWFAIFAGANGGEAEAANGGAGAAARGEGAAAGGGAGTGPAGAGSAGGAAGGTE